ncbi:alpha/beta fold hydrolase [Azohydromonas lata]|uniref:alpha/beta fold hydrolase n=1 Tax=Azohydromonas lata TaxID=45677 RepID=UPI001C3F48F4|nr:alpha/beta hydrolase [Azohydromonas lata]
MSIDAIRDVVAIGPARNAMNRRLHGALAVLLLAANTVLAAQAVPPSATATTSTENVKGRQVEYVLAGRGTPAVVFENGLGGALDNWRQVISEISKYTTVLAYNRPGYGDSAMADTPRDGEHIASELRDLLAAAHLKPPYVLVGHSAGGLYMQYFARRYPREVAGLILVDSTHPQQFQGKGALDGNMRPRRQVAAQKELDLLNATGEAVLALPTFTGKPVIVLSALKPLSVHGEYADDANEKRRGVARLYPGAKQVWVDSGHKIPTEKPENVTEAVQEMLAAVKHTK